MDQYIGKLLDNRYEILERIGTGGMAVVYKARCHRLNRLVAIKILKDELAQDAEFRRRFHDESQAVAMLSHPNIVAVYDVSKSTDIDYIVMELIDGITLKQYIQKRGGRLSWREALHFITQIMKGLSHAHGRGIIHRDIKPHNIMVLRDGSIKVADFGIARLTSAAQNTLTQEALGSVHYISPEQARGSHIDARSDIYSAGVVLYEMITGRLPYEGDSPVSVAIQHINSVPLSPREIDPEIPEALEAITMKAMASDVNRRYLSAEAMLADLEEFRKNPSINFDFTPDDLIIGDGEEPTQVLGANTPSGVHSQPSHMARETRDDTGGRTTRRRAPPQAYDYEYDDDYYEDRRPRTRTKQINWSVITAVGVVLLFLVGVGFVLWITLGSDIFGKDQTFPVPSVLGKTLEEAQDAVRAQSFTVKEGETIANDAPEGQIIAQSPEENTEVPAGERIITVTLSSGPASKPTMPSVTGKSLDEATRLLGSIKDVTLQIQQARQNDDAVEKDNIISQDPAEGTKLQDGQTVTLTISDGPKQKMVTILPFVGMNIFDAMSKIGTGENQYNLEAKPNEVYDDEVPTNIIIEQSIPVGTEVPEGTEIIFTISKGPDPNATPEPSPTPSPDVPPTPDQSAAPSESPQQPATTTQNLEIQLPRDRENVTVRVTVGGSLFSEQNYSTSLLVAYVPVTGSGDQEVVVYIDGEETIRKTVHFS